MSCIVYQIDKKTGTKYAYESESYWDSAKQQPRSRRKYLGKVDPATGAIIPGRKKRSSAGSEEKPDERQASVENNYLILLREKDKVISSLKSENAALKKEKAAILSALSATLEKYSG